MALINVRLYIPSVYSSLKTFKVAGSSDYGTNQIWLPVFTYLLMYFVDKSLYQFAFEEVGPYWKELGAALGFQMPELDSIEEYHLNRCLNVKFMAWVMLEKYRAANG